MIKRLLKLRQSQPDKKEVRIKALFSFLIDDYGFCFAKENLGDAVDKDGTFFFYGPVEAYFIYNDHVCINVLYLVQRQDFNIYITDKYESDQVYIRNGTEVASVFAYDLERFSSEVKKTVAHSREIYGREI